MSFQFSPETIVFELNKEIAINESDLSDAQAKIELVNGLIEQKNLLQPRSFFKCGCRLFCRITCGQKCNTCSSENDQALIDEINAEIQVIGNLNTLNDVITAETTMNETLRKQVESFTFEAELRESQRQAESLRIGEQLTAAFEAERLEKVRVLELAQEKEQQKAIAQNLEDSRIAQLKEQEAGVKTEHIVIAGAGVLAVSLF